MIRTPSPLSHAPLAERMRPTSLDDFVGQEELVGVGSFLRDAIAEDRVPSMILWGPPGSGKTTLAQVIAAQTRAEFVELSATSSGLKELREVFARASPGARLGVKTVLFVDEVHRWSKAQQDALLPYVERGTLTLMGATTENPSFEVNAALLSRCRVFVLQRLTEQDIGTILDRALTDIHRGLGSLALTMDVDARMLMTQLANGDARAAMNILEAASAGHVSITSDVVRSVVQKLHLQYDRGGEEHYNVISALHKSMRGGDADASVYWLARILEAGEDPLYVARRLVRFASEDVGLANNTALLVADAAFDACHKLGMPECSVHLAQAVMYLAKSPKGVAAYEAYQWAQRMIEEHGNLPVPLHLRNAPTELMRSLAYGKGYRYTPHEDSSAQTYLPEGLTSRQ